MTHTYHYHWGNTPERARRKGQRCRIVARSARRPGTPQSVLVEFGDGGRMITSLRALRRAGEGPAPTPPATSR